MFLFTNLDNVIVEDKKYNPVPVLKLTSNMDFLKTALSDRQDKLLKLLLVEARENRFQVFINNENLEEIDL